MQVQWQVPALSGVTLRQICGFAPLDKGRDPLWQRDRPLEIVEYLREALFRFKVMPWRFRIDVDTFLLL
jgi:hypothetical protein